MHRLLLACLVLLAVSCGDPTTSAPPPQLSQQRLVLEYGPGERLSRSPRIVETYDLVLDNAAWEVEAPFQRVQKRTDAKPGEATHMVILRADAMTDTLMLRRTGSFDPRTFNRIHVPSGFDGQGHLRAEFYRDGKLLGRSESVGLVPADELPAGEALPSELVVPSGLRNQEPFDTLELHVVGVYRFISLTQVFLVDEPPAGSLPAAGGPGDLVRVLGEARRGVGLFTGAPLQTRAQVAPEGGRLFFSFGQPVPEIRSAAPTTLTVRVEGEEVVARPLVAMPQPDTEWHAVDVSLAAWAGREVTLEFRLEGGPPQGLAGCVVAEPTLSVPEPASPTVVLITTDTHRADHMGFASDGVEIETPVLDALAARGLVFDDAQAPVNVTNPSHAALMTARSLRVTGVRTNYSRLSEAAPTLAEVFADQGWTTYAAVSTRHLGAESSGLGQGFDRMSWPRSAPQRPGDEALDDMLRWLPDADGRPLFVWLHVFDAHWPYEPEQRWVDRYWDPARDPEDPSLPDPGIELRALQPELHAVRDMEWPRSLYRAEISGLDEKLQRLLSVPRVEQGLVALTSDHGEALGEHGTYFKHMGLYRNTLHIPLVLAGPGVPQGERSDEPVMHLDIPRTLLDLAGMGDLEFPGRSLLEPRSVEPRYALEGYGFAASVTHEGLHLVLNLSERALPNVLETREHHEVELYEYTSDPMCERNLIDEPGRLADAAPMRAALIRWLQETPETGWAEARQDDAEFLESLKQLGYVAPEGTESVTLWKPDDCGWCARF